MGAIDGADDDANVGVGGARAPTAANGANGANATNVGATGAQRRAVRRLHASMEAFEAQLQCPICLCAYTAPASLPCNHCFCEECIHRALELKQVCPICKAPAKKRSLRHDTMIQQLQQAAELWASVASAVGDEEEEEEQVEEKETTPVRINPRIVAAAAAAAAASAGGSSSAESTSRRRKRAVEADDVPMNTTTLVATKTNGHARHAEDDDDEEMEEEEAEEEEEEEKEEDVEEEEEEEGLLEAKVTTPERVREDLLPSPAKRRAVAANGFGRKAWPAAGPSAHTNGHAKQQQMQPVENGATPHGGDAATAFTVGQLVEVIDRTWRGINKPGGAAWLTGVNGDGTYDVKYIIGTGRESNIPDQYILIPREEIGSLATPGRAVKQHRRKQNKLTTPPSVDLLGIGGFSAMGTAKLRRSGLVFLCSGYTDEEVEQIKLWADVLGAEVVENWSNFVTHLIAKCATPKEVAASLAEEDHYAGTSSSSSTGAHSRKRSLFKDEKHKRWVKIRSMKYLKALVAGRWIVSEKWLRDSVKHGKRLAEASYEADGHLKAQNIVAACQRSRTKREEILRSEPDEANPLAVGTRLFAEHCFHIYGEFLPPMPPPAELSTLIGIGGGKTIHFLDDIAMEMDKPENYGCTLVIISDKLNQQMLRRAAKELTALPQLQGVVNKHVVSYQWILNSISEAKLRPFN